MTGSPLNLERMRCAQASVMFDACIVFSHTFGERDRYNTPADVYAPERETACGYKPRSSRTVQQGNETIILDAEMRVPFDTPVSDRSLVLLTHRYGEELNPPLLFAVVGEPARGPSGILLSLARVTDDRDPLV